MKTLKSSYIQTRFLKKSSFKTGTRCLIDWIQGHCAGLFQSTLKKLDLEVWTVITWSLLSIGMLVTSLILKKFSYNRKPSVMELLFFLGEYQHFTAAQKKKKKKKKRLCRVDFVRCASFTAMSCILFSCYALSWAVHFFICLSVTRSVFVYLAFYLLTQKKKKSLNFRIFILAWN